MYSILTPLPFLRADHQIEGDIVIERKGQLALNTESPIKFGGSAGMNYASS